MSEVMIGRISDTTMQPAALTPQPFAATRKSRFRSDSACDRSWRAP